MFARLRSHISCTGLAAQLLVAAGLLLRLRAYFSGRSLWLDEAMLALNILQRDSWGLMKPLDYEQGAPLGFLLLQKAFTTLAGDGELGLRLLPFLAGCATLIFFPLLLKRYLAAPGLLLALALLAFSPTMIYYSAESKQYMLDAALTLVIFWLADGHHPWTLAIFGALALWFSHPLIFALAAVGLAGLIFERSRWRGWLAPAAGRALAPAAGRALAPAAGRALAPAALWLSSFGLLYIVNLRGLTQNQFLLDYWREFFPPYPPTFFWLSERLKGLLGTFNSAGLGLQIPFWLGLSLLAAGAFWLTRRQGRAAAQIGGVFVFALAAATLQKYPLGGRMALFLLPLTAALLGAGLDAFFAAARRLLGQRPAALGTIALGGFLLLAPAQVSLQRLVTPFMRENLHPALAALHKSHQPGDGIYIYPAASPAFLYYAPRYGFAPQTFSAPIYPQAQSNLPQILADLTAFSGAPRLWVLFAHVYEQGTLNEMQAALDFLEAGWRCKYHTRASGTGVTLVLCVRR